jgi:hypothetical protein
MSAAWRASAARARERAKADPSVIPHGTTTGYSYWWCRCPQCGEAARIQRAELRSVARQRAGAALTDFNRRLLASREQRKAAA